MTEELSKRDQFSAMMDDMRKGEDSAVLGAADYFKSPEAVGFRARIKDFHGETVPGSPFDQMFGSVLKIFDSMDTMLNQVVQAKAEAAAVAEKAKADPVLTGSGKAE